MGLKIDGSSLVGDGLTSCVYNFSNPEDDRTKIIIFTSDNELQGTPIVSLQEAADICKRKKITVYGISPDTITNKDSIDFKTAVEKTGGTLYVQNNSATVSSIVNNIEQKEKNLKTGQNEIRKIDTPQIAFITLTISLLILFILNKQVNL